MAKLQELAKGKVCLEIGAFFGRSTVCLAEVAKQVHTVDTFKASGSGAKQVEGDDLTTWDDFQTNTAGWDNIFAFIGRSEHYVPTFFIEFDLIFIDGGHKYEDVKQDIEVCWPKLKNGGIMAFHDYGGWPGVTKAIDERFDKGKIQGPVNSLAWVVKDEG